MSIHVRNLLAPSVAATRGATLFCVVAAELLRVARWTFASDDGGGRWAANVSVDEPGGANGFSVDPANPRVIYDPLGRFTAAMVTNGAMISLFATNDRNRGMWRIAERIDANRVRIASVSADPNGWTLESGIAGRIIDLDTWLTTGDWVLLSAPSPSNMQARIEVDSIYGNIHLHVRPRGKLGIATESAEVAIINVYYLYTVYFNMFADAQNLVCCCFTNNNGGAGTHLWGWGDLADASPSDDRPGFVFGHGTVNGDQSNLMAIRMLDHADGQITGYATFPKRDWGTRSSAQIFVNTAFRVVRGRVCPIRSPEVVMANVANGAYIRGRIPEILGLTHQTFERERPLDAAGNWQHLNLGWALRRNGPNDPFFVRPL